MNNAYALLTLATLLVAAPNDPASAETEVSAPTQVELAESKQADDNSLSTIDGWVRITPMTMTAGYLSIANPTDTPRKLVSASTPRAETVELHTHMMEDGVMRMRPVESFEVPANGTLKLAPGGNHLMIIGLDKPLTDGESLDITFTLDDGTTLTHAMPALREAPKKESDSPTHSE